MRPRKRDFRGDARKGAKNYGIVSSDDSEAYRRKDPFAGRNRKRPSGRRAQLKRVRKFAQSANLMSRIKAIVGKEAKIKNKVCSGREKLLRMIHSLRQTEDKGASSVLFPLRLPARTGASYICCEKPFSSASCVSVARHGIVVLRSYT